MRYEKDDVTCSTLGHSTTSFYGSVSVEALQHLPTIPYQKSGHKLDKRSNFSIDKRLVYSVYRIQHSIVEWLEQWFSNFVKKNCCAIIFQFFRSPMVPSKFLYLFWLIIIQNSFRIFLVGARMILIPSTIAVTPSLHLVRFAASSTSNLVLFTSS